MMKDSGRRGKQHKLTYAVFGIYFLMLTWLVLFKLRLPFDFVPGIRSLNLIPFYYRQENSLHVKEVLYNVLVFIPMGVYSAIFFRDRPFWLRLLPSFLISLLYESAQYAFGIGASDITDLITNTTGGLLGILLFQLLGVIMPNKRITLINLTGIAVEIAALVVLALLTI